MENQKKCNRCLIEKPLTKFNSDKSKKDGRHTICKECGKEYASANKEKTKAYMYHYNRMYVDKNKEVLKVKRAEYVKRTKSSKIAYDKQRYLSIRAKRIKEARAYYYKNKEAYSTAGKLRRENLTEQEKERNRLKTREWSAIKRKTDPMYNLKNSLRAICNHKLKSSYWMKRGRGEQILQGKYEEVRAYFQSLFKEGMSWDNHGEWEIDHVIPLSTATTEDHLIALCHYKNLQPLWKEENMKKGSKIPEVICL